VHLLFFFAGLSAASKQASKAGLVCTTTVRHHNSRFKNLVKLLRLPGKKKETSLYPNNQILPSSSAAAIFSTILNRIPKACLQTRKIRHKEENSTQSLFAYEKEFATKKRIPHKAFLHTRKNSPQKEENSTQSLFAHKKKFATKRREFHTKLVCSRTSRIWQQQKQSCINFSASGRTKSMSTRHGL